MKKLILAATAALTLAAPLAAAAQDVPSYAQAAYSGDEQIRGRIASFDGGYRLTVRDERGFVDDVRLHPGTIINPTGLTLEPGMVVSVIGANDGAVLGANEIDTPYTYDAGIPYYQGRAWNAYGPSFGLAFFFGNTGWWHGNAFAAPYRYDRGVRVYANVRIRGAAPRPDVAYRNVVRPAVVNVNVNVGSPRYVAPPTSVRVDERRYATVTPVRSYDARTTRVVRHAVTVTSPASHTDRGHR